MDTKDIEAFVGKNVKIYLMGSARLSGLIEGVVDGVVTIMERDGRFKLDVKSIAAIGEFEGL